MLTRSKLFAASTSMLMAPLAPLMNWPVMFKVPTVSTPPGVISPLLVKVAVPRSKVPLPVMRPSTLLIRLLAEETVLFAAISIMPSLAFMLASARVPPAAALSVPLLTNEEVLIVNVCPATLALMVPSFTVVDVVLSTILPNPCKVTPASSCKVCLFPEINVAPAILTVAWPVVAIC